MASPGEELPEHPKSSQIGVIGVWKINKRTSHLTALGRSADRLALLHYSLIPSFSASSGRLSDHDTAELAALHRPVGPQCSFAYQAAGWNTGPQGHMSPTVCIGDTRSLLAPVQHDQQTLKRSHNLGNRECSGRVFCLWKQWSRSEECVCVYLTQLEQKWRLLMCKSLSLASSFVAFKSSDLYKRWNIKRLENWR